MFKTLYCKPAEGKKDGSFLEAVSKTSLPPQRKAISETPEHPDPAESKIFCSMFNRISHRQKGSTGANKVVEID